MAAADDALELLRDRHAVDRLHARDATLWSDDPGHRAVAADRLGWLDVATGPEGWVDRLAAFAGEVRAAGVDRVVLAGMGGSSLAPQVFGRLFADRPGARLEVLDSTHPEAVRAVLD
ncbi:MAG: hypothetical protein ACRDU8_07215, partial [Egibacteraceae bacterium]